jgi:hypothetical protein
MRLSCHLSVYLQLIAWVYKITLLITCLFNVQRKYMINSSKKCVMHLNIMQLGSLVKSYPKTHSLTHSLTHSFTY